MKNLNQSEIDSFKESWYTFEEIARIDNALWEKWWYTPEEIYYELLKNREKIICTK